jgi:hypothetical protein
VVASRAVNRAEHGPVGGKARGYEVDHKTYRQTQNGGNYREQNIQHELSGFIINSST